MPGLRRVRAGYVASLHIGVSKSAAKESVPNLRLTFSGIAGDSHARLLRRAGAREPAYKRGSEIANLRQVSLVSFEELAIIAARMELATIDPGWIAANIAVSGAGPITQTPCGTIIRFGELGASLYVTDLNTPCSLASKLFAKAGNIEKTSARSFVENAIGRRGLLAIVYSEGTITVGDDIEFLYSKPELPLTE